MAKSKIGRSVKKCQRYLNEKRRIKNKAQKIDTFINHLKKEREQEKININNKLPVKRKPIENIIKSSKIGRKKEGGK